MLNTIEHKEKCLFHLKIPTDTIIKDVLQIVNINLRGSDLREFVRI